MSDDERCLLICTPCTETAGGDPLVMPFGTKADRDTWSAGHTEGTGHDDWVSFDGWPPLDIAIGIYHQHAGRRPR